MANREARRYDKGELRRRAEKLWRQGRAQADGPPRMEAPELLHELQVHQLELELQNEELRRAQEELAVSHARYFDLFDLAPVGYLILDGEGLIREANLAVADLLGVDRSRLIDQPLTHFIHRDDQDIHYLHRRRLSRGQPEACELRLQRSNGVQRWVRMQSALVQGSEGAEACRVALSDITESKQAGAALQASHDDLDQKVQERTGELAAANQALRQGRDELQSLARRLVEVQEAERRSIARELHDGAGQALTVMLYDLSALEQYNHDHPEAAARLQKMRQGVEDLMSDLRALSANLHPPALERVGLVGALRGMIESLPQTEALHFGFQAVGLESRRLPPAYEIAVYRMAQEAINNALRHAEARNIGVVLHLRDDYLQVVIEDDGVGFDPNAGSDTRHPSAGGLGLISMRERAEMLGGRLTIETRPGAGTTVFVKVPLQPAEAHGGTGGNGR